MPGWVPTHIQHIETVDQAGRLVKVVRVHVLTDEGWTLFKDFPEATYSTETARAEIDRIVAELRKLRA